MRRRPVKEVPVQSDLVNQAQIAELAGMHRNTARRHLEHPDAPQPQQHVGKIKKWSREEIVAWLKHGSPNWKIIVGETAERLAEEAKARRKDHPI